MYFIEVSSCRGASTTNGSSPNRQVVQKSSEQVAKQLAGAHDLDVGGAELGGEEVGGAGRGNVFDGGLNRLLVAHHRDVRRTGEALAVEHGAVARELAVHREDGGSALAGTVRVVGHADWEAGYDAERLGSSGLCGCRFE